MSSINLQSIHMLHLLWLLPLLLALFVYAGQMRRAALARFVDAGLLGKIRVSASAVKRRWKAALVLLAAAAVVIGLARPGWNPKPKKIQRLGRDVVFVLDVSRSMLAEDLAPNRLERAKLAIKDAIEKLRGDRVGLVAFAGSAVVKCPLTLDYGFFRMMLDQITPESIARGGTKIGDAVRKARNEVFDDQEKQFKDIVLITDGEDHDSFPEEAAAKAGERGIRIIAIGLGDEGEGRRIPVTDTHGNRTFLTHQGKEIWSKLDADTLRKMANATPGGRYLNVATGTIDLGDVYEKLIASAEKKELESKTIERYEEKFQIFLAVAFGLLCVETLVGERRRTA
ncbi:MAG: VWA domain-containing protein [Kiritimatiellae bacterium]|nr:VWA domain-containing protein [Kiritimatiellia bacterium]